ncbi:MAG: bifunctional diaminohydroxyphosphoribosylaminopyrimidine deaminase/5-amino-6-(5-phosphoribosylamino)uracil reductase RibD [candidate division WOR-3 bacterium]|nr:bifunctional diaminohydroxyphosphoribosylaminopyrimidine deaminase/5-amino-6-(5-phosphoribosylamino)uracil reductase RibD [candidate division WOR-3 bacterium]MCX7757072.1 bifunctional diaminohydroxyphosphoribosylaminopyrimidine deaminase/5-amino-6-(5-phosphoribosylamino)uracil reductase RibD [candidate division WOR-3 bacterium]MDW7987580.1 bifunctional diaminohydroxyphosphoribosylaminopyrimidine deaminase/5-amino-6-(5-phosphoribosylamino)uracil reductase RibD [candidate division WOR-3 bacteriu
MNAVSSFSPTDEFYMRYAMALAEQARGFTSPNPLVGAVVVKDHKIISEGYHEYFGGPHAEINALNNAQTNLHGATMYVTLEPCAFTNKKTPPCAPQLINAGLKRVVIGSVDPNPMNSNKGVRILRQAGIEVIVGVLADEIKRQNESYFKYIKQKIPFVTLKLALTLDGKIATIRGQSQWITSKTSREYVQLLRKDADAILVGIGTVIKDDPHLTCRIAPKKKLWRIILDPNFKIPKNAQVLHQRGPVLIFVNKRKLNKIPKSLGAEIVPLACDNEFDWGEILSELGKRNIASLLIEGGAQIASSALKSQIVDKVYLFYAPKILGQGLGFSDYLISKNLESALKLKEYSIVRCDVDFIIKGVLDK